MSARYLVIEIDTVRAFEVVQRLDPTYKELQYEDAEMCFLVLDYPIVGVHSLIRPENLPDATLKHPMDIKTWTLVKD